jgi:ankyrin repeat protein
VRLKPRSLVVLVGLAALGVSAAEPELVKAAESGDVQRIKALLKAGAKVDEPDATGRTALLAAAQRNQVEAARLLIAAGADVNKQDQRKDSAFLYAGAAGHLEILKLTWKAGANTRITNRYGGVALIPACERGHVETVEFLLTSTDTNVNHVNNLGWTGLLEAIILGDGGARHQRIVELLIRNRADVNLADKEGVTPLAHARKRGFREITSMLEKAGAR